MQSMLVGSLVVALAQNVGSQNVSKLDAPVGGEFRIDNPVGRSPCSFWNVLAQLAQRAHVLVGFENTLVLGYQGDERDRLRRRNGEVIKDASICGGDPLRLSYRVRSLRQPVTGFGASVLAQSKKIALLDSSTQSQRCGSSAEPLPSDFVPLLIVVSNR